MNEDYFLNAQEKQALKAWHAWLDDHRGDRARLRRADNPEDILLTSAFFHFLDHLPPQWRETKRLLSSASVAGALSHVKTDKSSAGKNDKNNENDAPTKSISFAGQLASPRDGKSKAPMSELRFQQLQKSPTINDFFRRIIRAVSLLEGNVNIVSLASDIVHWHQEFDKPMGRSPRTRLAVKWATEYYTALPKNAD